MWPRPSSHPRGLRAKKFPSSIPSTVNRLTHKVALVTWGALGIGRATGLLFAREGASVAVADVRDTEGRALAEEIRRAGGTAECYHLDVSREEEVRATS